MSTVESPDGPPAPSPGTVAAGAVRRFAAECERLRNGQGLSRKQLADRCGMSTASILGLENGTHGPSLRTAATIAAVLGTTVESMTREVPRG